MAKWGEFHRIDDLLGLVGRLDVRDHDDLRTDLERFYNLIHRNDAVDRLLAAEQGRQSM
jgi:hypothetical protein